MGKGTGCNNYPLDHDCQWLIAQKRSEIDAKCPAMNDGAPEAVNVKFTGILMIARKV